MSRNRSWPVGSQKRIGIKITECEIQIRGEAVVQSNGSGDGQLRLLEIRVGLEIELAPLRNRIDVKIARPLFIQCEVFEMYVRFERRLLGGAGDFDTEIGDAVRCQFTGLQARETGKVKITSRKT